MFLFVTTALFLALYASSVTGSDEIESRSKRRLWDWITDIKEQVAAEKICVTPECVLAAAAVIDKMNLSVDPCTDFHEYACGRFNKKVTLPEGRTQAGIFTIINDENLIVQRDIVTEEITPDQPQYLQNMRRFYKSCINEAQIEAIGLKPYFQETDFVKDWPTLNPDWNNSTFNLNDVIARYDAAYVEALFVYTVTNDLANSSRKVLYLADTQLGLSQEYYSRPRNDTFILAYQTFLTDAAVELGANRAVAEQDAKDVVDFEIALSKIMSSAADRRNPSKIYNPTTLNQLSTLYPNIDYARAIRAAFSTANLTLSDDEKIINMYPTYQGNLSLVIRNFSSRVIQNLFGFRYALPRVVDLTKRMRDIKLAFDKAYTGKAEQTPRWRDCLSKAASYFRMGMSKQFVSRTFSEKAKTYMDEMIDNLKTAFRQILEESTWLAQTTREIAYQKLAAMSRKIGYPDTNFTDADIDKKYEKHIMLEDNYYANLRVINRLSNIDVITSLRTPLDKTEWKVAPHDVNAYYSTTDNEILFPAGILQSPVYSDTFFDSMNYGAIGMVIGHEITHGFDYQGSQFDAQGNLVNWWPTADRQAFVQRLQCILTQYSNFRVNEIGLNVSGINTYGEDVADNGGLKESFRAFKALQQKQKKRQSLPGLNLSHDQLFFLSFGQLWCEKMTRERLISQVSTDSHPPGKYRIIGALQNSQDFAKAYNCPAGSYMNPETKCSVW